MILGPLLFFANHLWQSTLFAAAAALLTLALRKDRAQSRYAVWLAASMKFLIPFSPLVDMGRHLGQHAAPPSLPAGLSYVIGQASQPFIAQASTVSLQAAARTSSVKWLAAVVCAFWAAGCAGLIFSWWRRWRRFRAVLRTASPFDLDARSNRGVKAVTSPAFGEPGVFGVRRPVLLLPEGLADRLTSAQLKAIVAHELCHVRRRDNLAAALHMAVEALFWFHPLVWWLGARLVEERERACDEEVLLTGTEPEAYAEGILRICEMRLESPPAWAAGVTGANLTQRIEEIMARRIGRRLSLAKKIVVAAAGAASLMAPVLTGILNAPAMEAQGTAASAPKFKVVAVKRCKTEPGMRRGVGDSSPGRLSTGCDLLVDENNIGLIQRAYIRFAGGHPNPLGVLPIKGGPKWIRSEMYSIEAKAEGSPGREMMQGPMLQAVLEDRFRLKIHRVTREGPVYALTRGNGGPGLKPFHEGSCAQMPMTFPLPALPSGQRYCRVLVSFAGSVEAEGSTLTEFSKLLNLVLDRPVIDRTGITGRFDIHVEFARDEVTPGLVHGPVPDASAATASDPGRPTIFAAVQEQLGLKLTPAKGPVEFLQIDHIERPTEN